MWWIVVLALIVAFALGVVIYFKLSSVKKDHLAKTVSILGGFTAAVSLFWAAYTFYASAELQRELAASALYREHMTKSLEHPELADGEIAPIAPDMILPETNDAGQSQTIEQKKAYEQYRWYVGHALYSFETMLEIVADDPAWEATFKDFIKDHGEYIRRDFPCERYSDKLNALISEVLQKQCTKKPQR